MARPKTGKPRKQNLMLSVDIQTRSDLNFISKYRQKSISELLTIWTKADMTRIIQENPHSPLEISLNEKDSD